MAATAAPTSSYYRIQDVATQLYVRFSWKFTDSGKAIVRARLTRRDWASRFTRRLAAEEAFSRYIGAAPLEIVRSDA